VAEPFNPNEFRKQMGGHGSNATQVPKAPSQVPASQMPGQPYPQAQPGPPPQSQQFPPPRQGHPGQAPNPYILQPPQTFPPTRQSMPQAVAPQFQGQTPAAHDYASFQGQSPQGQTLQAQSYQGQNYQQASMEQGAIQKPLAKNGLFRRNKLNSDKSTLEGHAQSLHMKKPFSPMLAFAGGLVLGVIGTIMSIMVFSGGDAEKATQVAKATATPAIELADGDAPLTDEMLLDEKKGNRQ